MMRPALPAAARLEQLVNRLVTAGAATAAVALVGSAREVLWSHAAAGSDAGPGSPPDESSLFDLASLTKPWVGTLALRLDQEGRLPLAVTLGEIWSGEGRLAGRTLESLLRHEAGLRAWAPLYALCPQPGPAVAELLLGERLLGGATPCYSDLGYILWGLSVERALGRSLAELTREVLAPVLPDGSLPAGGEAAGAAVPCLLDGSREVELAADLQIRLTAAPPPPARGEAQDGNARFLGGLAGHAGLFASARAQWELARHWLRPGDWLAAAQADRALRGGGSFALGWRRGRGPAASASAPSRSSFGHTGFTGGSLWIEPRRDRVLVLLAHRSTVRVDLDPWRRSFHRLALGG